MEWLKVLLEKVRIHSFIGAMAFVCLAALIFSFNMWILLFVFCVSFLLIEFFIYLCKKLEEKESQHEKYKNVVRENDEILDRMWHLFWGLSDADMKFLKGIYFIEDKDPADKYVRFIRQDNSYYNKVYSDESFDLPLGDRTYIPCIGKDFLGNTIVLHFHYYFYDLLEHYLKTGKKEKLR
jgi:predicted membrane protein